MSARRPRRTERPPVKRDPATEPHTSDRVWDLLSRLLCDVEAHLAFQATKISVRGAPVWVLTVVLVIAILRLLIS